MGRDGFRTKVSEYFRYRIYLHFVFLRKYHRGKRVRKAGVQWGLTGVQVDELTGKTLMVDLQLLPYNRRDESTISPRIVQRMQRGGTVVSDGWKAYPGAAKAAGCKHLTVNHSENYVGPDGTHSNNVEGRF